jgi:small-conductance mechanosensitive channel
MKRILLVTFMLLLAGMMVYAQQAGASSQPTSAQTKSSAQQAVTEAKTNSSQFESTLADIKTKITSNSDAATYKRLKNNIDQLEAKIKNAQAQVQAEIDQGRGVSAKLVDQIQQLIDQHKVAIAEMEAFLAKS